MRVEFDHYDGLWVDGVLQAVGTQALPIVFTGSSETPGWWWEIEVRNAGSATLDHVEVAYAGYSSGVGVKKSGSGGLSVQNSTIRNTGGTGLWIVGSTGQHAITRNTFTANGTGVLVQNQTETLYLVNNLIEGNTNFGVRNQSSAVVYARYNWWGHASGPKHATINPNGQGDTVSNDVLFSPWNDTRTVDQEVPAEVLVTSHGPATFSPGQTLQYAVNYLSLMPSTVEDAVLVVQLPAAAEYLSSTDGTYWPDRHQVFWLLGNILPDGRGVHSVEVRYQWGLPLEYTDGVIALLGGVGFNPTELDLTAYTTYVPIQINTTASVSHAALQTILAEDATLRDLFDSALAEGFSYDNQGGLLITLDTGDPTLQITLVKSDRSAMRYIRRTGDQVHAITHARDGFTMQDSSGGIHIPVDTKEPAFFGDWDEEIVAQAAAGCNEGRCFWNCALLKGVECATGLDKVLGVLNASACVHPNSPECLKALQNLALDAAGVPCIAGVIDCKGDCQKDINSHCCSGDQVLVAPVRSGFVAWVGDNLDREACSYRNCNPTTGTWDLDTFSRTILCPKGERCVARRAPKDQRICQACGGDVLEVTATELCNTGGGATCGFSIVRRARDPNEKFGPVGDLLPGQLVTYTITYENEGAGTAYGVYVVDELSEVFDASSLTIQNGGRYISDIRTLLWDVGELTPKGETGSKGQVAFSVRLLDGLAGGTAVVNEAVVHFPSVPEVTPTGAVINLVQPVVATPQELTTAYMTPLPLTLAGREVSGLPLTFEIVEQPRGGLLSGTAPSVTYTPLANFTGPDSFTFRVSNGTSTSRAAQVRIEVTTIGDTTSPTVVWTSPDADAKNVSASASPIYTGTAGPVYAPVIMIGVSEALSETTVTTATVTLADSSGKPVTGTVRFDGAVNQIVFAPLAPLTRGTYTVTVSTGVADMAGNGLAAPHILAFTVKDEQAGVGHLLAGLAEIGGNRAIWQGIGLRLARFDG